MIVKLFNILLLAIIFLLVIGCGENTTKYSGEVSDQNISSGTVLQQDITYEESVGPEGDAYSFVAGESGYYRVSVETDSSDAYYFSLSVTTETEEKSVDEVIAYFYLEKGSEAEISVLNNRPYAVVEAEYSITVSSTEVTRDGNATNPVELPLQSTSYTEVGVSEIGGDSYYMFTSEEAGNYAISASSYTVEMSLHRRETFDYLLASDSGVLRAVLDANTTYYLKASNDGLTDIQFTLQITKEDSGSEGAIGDPVLLAPDITHRAKVGLDDWNEDNSYYRFSTDAITSLYVISFLKRSSTGMLYHALYGDSDFQNRLTFPESADRIVAQLTPSTTYYLKVNNFFGSEQIDFDLTLAEPEGTVAITEDENLSAFPVQLQTDKEYVAHVGTLSENGSESFYSFTTGAEIKPVLIGFSKSDDLHMYLYNDPNYTDEVGLVYESPYLLSEPEPGKTYYIKMVNYTNSEKLTYRLLIQPDP